MHADSKPHSRLGCSTISFRLLALDEAPAQIAELGFLEIDLGALPGHPISNLI
jgi:sugar phosphate isomerase/epimerase